LPTLAAAGEIGIIDALIGLGFCASKGEARRLIAGGGARVDGEKVEESAMLTAPARVSAGKKLHGMLVIG
jgi:tyrosyl-tRNA synthetase